MATTFTELKAEVASNAHRANLTSVIPTLIGYAEKRLATDLLVPPLVSTATVTISAAASSGTIPTGAFEIVGVNIASGDRLHYVTPDSIPEAIAQAGSIEKPIFWSFRGTSLLIAPAWTAGGNLSVQYFKQETALSGSTATNWYLDNAANALLYACMIELSVYTGTDPVKLKKWGEAYEYARDQVLQKYGVVDVGIRAKQFGAGKAKAVAPAV